MKNNTSNNAKVFNEYTAFLVENCKQQYIRYFDMQT